MSYLLVHWSVFGVSPHQAEIVILTTGWGLELEMKVHHIGYEKVSSVRRSVSRPRRFVLRMRAILLLCQSVGHFSEVLK